MLDRRGCWAEAREQGTQDNRAADLPKRRYYCGPSWHQDPTYHCSLTFELFLLEMFSGNSAFPLRVVTAESPSLPMKWRVEGKVWTGNLKKMTKDGEWDD